MNMRLLAGLVLIAASALGAPPKNLTVQVRAGQVRATASFLGKVVAELPYGTQVSVVAPSKPWTQVRAPDGVTGWMHESALTASRLELKGGTDDAQAGTSAREVSLAAKGFTQQIESEYRAQNPAVDYVWVDKMESFRVSPAEAQAFLAAGRVAPREGGAR